MEQAGNSGRYDDEIDLRELFAKLWAERWLILAVTLLVFVAAATYAFTAPPVYSSSVVITPAPISQFGQFAGHSRSDEGGTVLTDIGQGRKLASDALQLLASNLESASVQRQFQGSLNQESAVSLSLGRQRQQPDLITLTATSASAEAAKNYLDSYLTYSAQLAVADLNGYFKAMGIEYSLQPESIYRLEQAAQLNPHPIKPKKPLILAIGLVLGGMLGVFTALIRSMLRKDRPAKA